MSKSEIAAWVASATATDGRNYDDDDSDSEATPTADSVQQLGDEENWKKFVELSRQSVLSSKTKPRTEFIIEKLLAVAVRGGTSHFITLDRN